MAVIIDFTVGIIDFTVGIIDFTVGITDSTVGITDSTVGIMGFAVAMAITVAEEEVAIKPAEPLSFGIMTRVEDQRMNITV